MCDTCVHIDCDTNAQMFDRETQMCDGHCNTHCDTGLCIAQCRLQTIFAIVVEVTNHQQPNYCGLASLLKARQGDIEEVSGSLSCANLRVWRVLVPFQGKVAPGHRAEIWILKACITLNGHNGNQSKFASGSHFRMIMLRSPATEVASSPTPSAAIQPWISDFDNGRDKNKKPSTWC